jgi:hypothetical protein
VVAHVLHRIAAGLRLVKQGGTRSLARAIPLVGAAIGGAVEVFTTESVGHRAKET